MNQSMYDPLFPHPHEYDAHKNGNVVCLRVPWSVADVVGECSEVIISSIRSVLKLGRNIISDLCQG